MKVYLRDFRPDPKAYTFSNKDGWIWDIMQKNCESESCNDSAAEVHVSLERKSGIYKVGGTITGTLQLVCSRCAEEISQPIDLAFDYSYTQDKNSNQSDSDDYLKVTDISVLETEELTYIDNNFVDLEEIVNEQIVMSIPYIPLCSADCKGICATCGTNLNHSPCEHHPQFETGVQNGCS